MSQEVRDALASETADASKFVRRAFFAREMAFALSQFDSSPAGGRARTGISDTLEASERRIPSKGKILQSSAARLKNSSIEILVATMKGE
jgi:hypothetical protein